MSGQRLDLVEGTTSARCCGWNNTARHRCRDDRCHFVPGNTTQQRNPHGKPSKTELTLDEPCLITGG